MPIGGRPPGSGPPAALIAVVAGVVVLALVAAGFAVTALAGDDESASSDRTTTTRQQTTTTEDDEEDDEAGDGSAPAPSTTAAPTPAVPDAPSGAGGGGAAPPATTGDVVVELGWSGGSDLDLSVVGPDGSEAAFGRTSATGGTHGGDAQPGCGATGSQRETVTWFGAAPRGGYQVVVNGFDDCGAGPTSFDITVTVGGQVVDAHGGTVAVGQRATSSFTIG